LVCQQNFHDNMFTESVRNIQPLDFALAAEFGIPLGAASSIVKEAELEGKKGGDVDAQTFNELKVKSVQIAELPRLLDSAYTNFSDGGKWAFGAAYDVVVNHIRRGDIAAAKLTVQMASIPAEVPGVSAEELATWTAKKTEILALFP